MTEKFRTTRARSAPGADIVKHGKKTVNISARLRPNMGFEDDALATWASASKNATSDTRTLHHVPNAKARANMTKRYDFQEVYQQEASNHDIFEGMCYSLLEEFITGVDEIIFAYGQSLSGKTYTFLGDLESEEIAKETAPQESDGLILRSLLWLSKQEEVKSITLRAVETYGLGHINRVAFYDLGAPENQTLNWDDKKSARAFDFYKLHTTTIKPNTDRPTIIKILSKLFSSQHTAPTGKNPISSRGHVVYTVTVDLAGFEDASMKPPNLTFVDLSASQSIQTLRRKSVMNVLSQDELKTRQREMTCINEELIELKKYFIELQTMGVKKWAKRKEKKSVHIGIGLRQLLFQNTTTNCSISVLFVLAPSVTQRKNTTYTLQFAEEAKLITSTFGRMGSVKKIKAPPPKEPSPEPVVEQKEEESEIDRLKKIIAERNSRIGELESQLDELKSAHPTIVADALQLSDSEMPPTPVASVKVSFKVESRLQSNMAKANTAERRLSRNFSQNHIVDDDDTMEANGTGGGGGSGPDGGGIDMDALRQLASEFSDSDSENEDKDSDGVRARGRATPITPMGPLREEDSEGEMTESSNFDSPRTFQKQTADDTFPDTFDDQQADGSVVVHSELSDAEPMDSENDDAKDMSDGETGRHRDSGSRDTMGMKNVSRSLTADEDETDAKTQSKRGSLVGMNQDFSKYSRNELEDKLRFLADTLATRGAAARDMVDSDGNVNFGDNTRHGNASKKDLSIFAYWDAHIPKEDRKSLRRKRKHKKSVAKASPWWAGHSDSVVYHMIG